MSRWLQEQLEEEQWGPSHQRMEAPFQRRHPFASCFGVVFSFLLLLFFVGFIRSVLELKSGSTISWTIGAAIVLVVGRLLLMFAVGVFTRTPRTPRRPEPLPSTTCEPAVHVSVSPATRVREGLLRVGGGAYLGVRDSQEWATADPETAAMILGPPRSGKTTAVMIPALMAASGPAVSTSTKPDVMEATIHARGEIGEVWLFDPSGTEPLPEGVRRLSWSPVSAAATWDGALVTARAMTAASRAGVGTTNESHWSERAAALLAPLLYAAQLTDRPIEEVLRWTLRQDLTPALEVLADAEGEIAADVLVGVERTDTRERSSIFSATAGVLSAYNSDGARQSAASPNFDPDQFAASTDTLYITSPEQHQAACAPLIVGLLEQVRHAVYARARGGQALGPGMLWLLDEVANIAPIHDLPALVSQAGGQNLQVVIGLQDLSQARTRWGTGRGRWVPLHVPGEADPQRDRGHAHPRSDLPGARRIRPRHDQPLPRPQRAPRMVRRPDTLRHRQLSDAASPRPHAGGDREAPRRPRAAVAGHRLGVGRAYEVV